MPRIAVPGDYRLAALAALAAFFFRDAQDFFIRSETARLCAGVIFRRCRPVFVVAVAVAAVVPVATAGVVPPVNAAIALSIRLTSASRLFL